MYNIEDMDVDFLKIQYQVLSNRQQAHNAFVWNVPVLLFAAESFLWDLALDKESPDIISCIVAFISALIAFASWQQFERGRLMEIADSEQLYAIETALRDIGGGGIIIHHTLEYRTTLLDMEESNLKLHLDTHLSFIRHNPLSRFRTFYVWKAAFIIAFFFSLFLLLYNLKDTVPYFAI